jgi:hypothetical protein
VRAFKRADKDTKMTADYQMFIWPAACTDATKHLAGRRYPLTNAELKEARRLGMTPSAFVIAREVTRAKDAGPSLARKPPVETRKASKPASSIPRLSEDERRVARMFAMSDEAYVAHREQLAAKDREEQAAKRRRDLYAEPDED